MTAFHVSDLFTSISLAVDCLALLWLWRNRNRLFTERHRETETDEPDEGMGLREVEQNGQKQALQGTNSNHSSHVAPNDMMRR
jgi:hypothetical protein